MVFSQSESVPSGSVELPSVGSSLLGGVLSGSAEVSSVGFSLLGNVLSGEFSLGSVLSGSAGVLSIGFSLSKFMCSVSKEASLAGFSPLGGVYFVLAGISAGISPLSESIRSGLAGMFLSNVSLRFSIGFLLSGMVSFVFAILFGGLSDTLSSSASFIAFRAASSMKAGALVSMFSGSLAVATAQFVPTSNVVANSAVQYWNRSFFLFIVQNSFTNMIDIKNLLYLAKNCSCFM